MTKPKTKFIPKTGLLIPDTHIQTGDDLGRRLSPPVSKQTIAHWEADRYRPHVDQVAQLCLILGMIPFFFALL